MSTVQTIRDGSVVTRTGVFRYPESVRPCGPGVCIHLCKVGEDRNGDDLFVCVRCGIYLESQYRPHASAYGALVLVDCDESLMGEVRDRQLQREVL